ncbi:ABC-type transporter, periplasmic subunit family 3 [Thiorhodococcus drewsii AZ1]|uniref:ABC-type transporter, periplasmic subunit family 3 n=1 Tax=Thiorhodococcus drewsii AZ1 TaxID=765913 RepID=G2E419_9GAMM|nr:transporter substrate-binding domain-containing protein [Thiorhodococcus drewsii]EGV29912.1 ABC-type transporter, periplasmic subunit family 3 [Thiorhodococcus drewsii AZ1]
MGSIRLVCLLVCLVGYGFAAAEEAAEKVPARYLVGVENIDYRPFQNGLSGRFEGFGRDLLDAFAEDAGIQFDYLPMPPSRLLASLLRDRIDFKYPDDPSWRPELRVGHDIQYSRPIVDYLDGTLVPPSRVGDPISKIRTLGAIIGFAPVAWVGRIEAGQLTLMENADLSALFQQVLAGRLDAAYANIAVAKVQSERIFGNAEALVYDPRLPHATGQYRLSSRHHAEVLVRFDRWLLENAERVSRLKRRAGLTDPPGLSD